MTRIIRLGISPCPNDTFAFHALLARKIAIAGLELAIELADIEALNLRFARGELDAAKVSFAAALRFGDRCRVLPSGAALGFGVGPLLLARRGMPGAEHARIPAGARVLLPGEHTTAHLLFRLFHPEGGHVEHVPFFEIMPALERGDADFGVCIHEGRFTWREHELELVEDLGSSWESRTRAPLPLGGIVVARDLPRELATALDRAIKASIDYAREHREEASATMREHARELSDAVLWAHVELYVTNWTRDMGSTGARALAELARAARAIGWTRDAEPALELLARA
jgi:1,4-dihydroxy-6-naphthoate synthase